MSIINSFHEICVYTDFTEMVMWEDKLLNESSKMFFEILDHYVVALFHFWSNFKLKMLVPKWKV